MKRDDIPHTYVQMRNSSDLTHNKHILTDLVCLMAGQCFKLGTKRGLCFLTEKRELVTKEAKGYLDDFKRRGIEVIIIFVEDLLDELPSEAKSVCKFIEELPDCIKLFTDDHWDTEWLLIKIYMCYLEQFNWYEIVPRFNWRKWWRRCEQEMKYEDNLKQKMWNFRHISKSIGNKRVETNSKISETKE